MNKVSTRVSLRHIPTGITVHVQDSRSQGANRRIARERDDREKKRRRDRPKTAKVKRVQVESKRRRSETKKLRGRVED